MMKKKRFSFDFDPKAQASLTAIAGELGVSKAAVVRRALGLLSLALKSDDKTVSLQKDGNEVRYVVAPEL